ncbi:19014_t:CDS:2 [Entrophospora sp. SA101]|nr:19011_t:CDS:2 [Entrophospora sp. SA101]CAJ0831045.1 19014_t:CDS:2 [Entrophospora sp. SA101]
MKLDNKSTQVDMMLELCNYGVEIISVEVGNTEELNIDDMKVCRDHTALKIELKDMLDNFRDKLYFVKEDYTEIFMIGIQVSGNHWTIYSLSYNYGSRFYFFSEMATLDIPMTLSMMDEMLDILIQNFLGLLHTLLWLNKKISAIAKICHSTPPPPSSPLHETTNTPNIIQVKNDVFSIFDHIY